MSASLVLQPRVLLRFALLLVLLGMLVITAAPADAQTLLLTLDTANPKADAQFGTSVAMGDVNGDGKDDIVVGAYHEDVGGNSDQGRVYVFSGADGSLLFTLDTPNPQTYALFGTSAAVEDVNGDGKGDIAVGAFAEVVDFATRGRAYVFSGADGSLIFTLESPNRPSYNSFGNSLALGDVNGDGVRDIVVGAFPEHVSGATNQGRAYIFSGVDGSLLRTLDTPSPQDFAYFGWSVAAADVDGDGKADVAVGAPDGDTRGTAYAARAYVFSGVDGSMLFTLNTPNPQPRGVFGVSVAMGDVNGDGRPDIVVGSSVEDVESTAGAGRAHVFSGVDGSLLFSVESPVPQTQSRFGHTVAAGDVNGDGRDDIAVGAYMEDVGANADQGRAYAFSGADGSLLFTMDSPNPQAGAQFGYSFPVLAMGDANGDGRHEIVVAAPFEDVGGNIDQGRAYVFSGPTPAPTPTATPTRTPSPRPTPTAAPTLPPQVPGVGGAVLLPAVAVAAPSESTTQDSGCTSAVWMVFAGTIIGMLAMGRWYVRSRRRGG